MSLQDTPDWLSVAPTGNFQVFPYQTVTVGAGATVTNGPWYVGNFGSLFIHSQSTNAISSSWMLQWLSTSGGAPATVPTDSWVKNSANQLEFVRGVLAPYVQLKVTNNAGTSQTFPIAVTGIATGSGQPIQVPKLLVSVQQQSVAASGTFTAPITVQQPGRCHMWSLTKGSTGGCSVNRWNGNTYDTMAEVPLTANQDDNHDLVLPLDDVQVQLFNNDVSAANMWVEIVGPG